MNVIIFVARSVSVQVFRFILFPHVYEFLRSCILSMHSFTPIHWSIKFQSVVRLPGLFYSFIYCKRQLYILPMLPNTEYANAWSNMSKGDFFLVFYTLKVTSASRCRPNSRSICNFATRHHDIVRHIQSQSVSCPNKWRPYYHRRLGLFP